MRRRLSSAAFVLTALALLPAAPGPAAAMPTTEPEAAARGGLKCRIGVVGFDSAHHVRYDSFTNGRLVRSTTSGATLPFDVTAWGYFGSSGTAKRNTLQLNVISADGTPRNVTLKRKPHSVRIGKVKKYQERSFSPRLYADGYTYFAYTVNGGTMKRWSLTRFPDGDVRFARPVRVGGGFGDLTSLQAASASKVRGVPSEVLYGTTGSGKLLQIVVPLERPNRARVHKLARSGYQGVTELSWSFCNNDGTHHTLIAIDPIGNRATWTTIKRAFNRPKPTLRGDVTGVSDWNLSAGY